MSSAQSPAEEHPNIDVENIYYSGIKVTGDGDVLEDKFNLILNDIEEVKFTKHLEGTEPEIRLNVIATFLGFNTDRSNWQVQVNSGIWRNHVPVNILLHVSVEMGYVDVMKILINDGPLKADVNSDWQDLTPFLRAVKSGSVDCVQYLVEHGAKVQAKTPEGLTSLHIAALYGQAEVIRMMVLSANTYHVDVNAKAGMTPYSEWTPTHCAASKGHRLAVQVLQEFGALLDLKAFTRTRVEQTQNNVKTYSLAGFTPLHLAAANGYSETVAYLLKNGADVNTQSVTKRTPLHLAAIEGFTKAAEELLKSDRIKINAMDKYWLTPLDVAIRNKRNEMTIVLRKAGGLEL
ncbi:ankyrin repeat-containing domain protein [Jimgerdemannia flammicorona]|uniref:Ankyrin repeat-containing domain protein n=1 Tax=Jimgerdemannia flammicorona TaxID=994334 RepID=A0A433QWQ5_9FUNG|nr:ankyrin repeat-containing domain protein [Jimgerdemannia flammicorona]